MPQLIRNPSAFLDELRCKLANLKCPDIEGKTTVSIGLCIVESDCPLTDMTAAAVFSLESSPPPPSCQAIGATLPLPSL